MPLLHVFSSAPALDPATRTALLRDLSATLARELDKPQTYVMVALEPSATMWFGGDLAPACYAELKNVGTLAQPAVERLSDLLCTQLARGLALPRDRIYLEFTNADGALWGWNGSTFAG